MKMDKGLKGWMLGMAFFLILLGAARATVVIYKGAGSRTSGSNVVADRIACQIYWIFDFDTLVGNLIILETRNKIVFDNGPRRYGIAELNTLPKDTIYLTSGDASFVGPRNFALRHVRFQGAKSLIQLLPGGVLPGNLPANLTGFHSDTFGTPFGFVASYTLAFNAARTQAANAGNKTVAIVSADIRSELVSRLRYTDTTNQQFVAEEPELGE